MTDPRQSDYILTYDVEDFLADHPEYAVTDD